MCPVDNRGQPAKLAELLDVKIADQNVTTSEREEMTKRLRNQLSHAHFKQFCDTRNMTIAKMNQLIRYFEFEQTRQRQITNTLAHQEIEVLILFSSLKFQLIPLHKM